VLVGMAGPFGMIRQHVVRDWAQRQPDCNDFLCTGTASCVTISSSCIASSADERAELRPERGLPTILPMRGWSGRGAGTSYR